MHGDTGRFQLFFKWLGYGSRYVFKTISDFIHYGKTVQRLLMVVLIPVDENAENNSVSIRYNNHI